MNTWRYGERFDGGNRENQPALCDWDRIKKDTFCASRERKK